MLGIKVQIAVEYIIITSVILTIATTVFTYSYLTNNQNVRLKQANNAVEKITNAADLVYALGPGNSQFLEITFPQGIELVQDLTLCQGAGGTYQQHYGQGEESCPGDEVKAGAVEMRLNAISGTFNIKSASKAEIEMDVVAPEESLQATGGKRLIKVYWCGEKICASRVERAVSEECLNGTTRDCPLKNENCLANSDTCVCTTALETCIGGVWPGCDKETYQDYNLSYEIIETTCNDRIDNDCDGLTDCFDMACRLSCRCESDETRLCALQEGVCAGATETCVGRQWPGCDSGNYDVNYEIVELSCNNGLDNDCDGLTDCDDLDCANDPACGFEARTTIYMTSNRHQGDLGGSSSTDAICEAEKPSNLPSDCSNIKAFLCNSTRQVLDLQSDNGGPYDSDKAIYWWHSIEGGYTKLAENWADMLDGSITTNQLTGTGMGGTGPDWADYAWTGCKQDGTLSTKTCLGWSSNQSASIGNLGDYDSTDSDWIADTRLCNANTRLRCIAGCTTEINCGNNADDDGDGLPDCLDPDCATDAVCESKTVIYVTPSLTPGNLGGRSGADAFCEASKPSNLPPGCIETHAFLSVNTADEIRDMPARYGYESDKAIYWWHNEEEAYYGIAFNWAGMLDGSISASQQLGTGINVRTWTGSDQDGSITEETCTNWTSSDPWAGTFGEGSFTDLEWLKSSAIVTFNCGVSYGLRCASICPAALETDCTDGLDNDNDAFVDCEDADCEEEPACIPVLMPKTVVYIASSNHNGNLGGRSGADALCESEKPSNLTADCNAIHAFVSVSNSDEIRDMPTNYGYDSSKPISWWNDVNRQARQFAADWTDMLDGSIGMSQATGTDILQETWTGSLSSGAKYSQTCSGWTSSEITTNGNSGSAGTTDSTWLEQTFETNCGADLGLRCIGTCLLETETFCADDIDNDKDGYTDCADTDCVTDSACPPSTVIYMATSNSSGNLGGREGADDFCLTNKPGNFPATCHTTHAFLSVGIADEIRDMPTNYGYDSAKPISWWNDVNQQLREFATDWTDMLDGTIAVSQHEGTGTGEFQHAWSGSQLDGSKDPWNCSDWTTEADSARPGLANSTSQSWLEPSFLFGCNGARVRCISICPTEIEMDCTDKADNDEDSLTDCVDPDCVGTPECPEKTVLYATTAWHHGDLASEGSNARDGADNWCESNKPGNLPENCDTIHAFLSVSMSDEVRDMPTNYGYDSSQPIGWWNDASQQIRQFATDWADMLDESISLSQEDGTGNTRAAWTGSDPDGSISTETCSGWTSWDLQDYPATIGAPTATNRNWLGPPKPEFTVSSCASSFAVRCAAKCTVAAETLCRDDIDNDEDSLIDCEDPDCATEPLCDKKTAIYMATSISPGDFGGRSGGDAFCQANKPANFPLTSSEIHSFLSVNDSDEIRDMPANYGYDSSKPVYWWKDSDQSFNQFANNWADMLDNTISLSQQDGTGVGWTSWTGSNEDGSIAGSACMGWTDVMPWAAERGLADAIDYEWLYLGDFVAFGCDVEFGVRCISEYASAVELECADGTDDDEDGFVDCQDPDCNAMIGPDWQICEPFGETTCNDGYDNDSDNLEDCADPDCTSQRGPEGGYCRPGGETLSYCRDGYDNDNDGLADCADIGCDGYSYAGKTCQSFGELTCNDGHDNDDDGYIDCLDPDCSGMIGSNGETCNPLGETACSDGYDNDLDGFVDCADPSCAGGPDCMTEVDCANQADDDMDGLSDCLDPECDGNPACPMQTVIYIASLECNGDLGGRSGADSFCTENKPGNLPESCDTIHAFLSVENTTPDQISDMPANYGYDPNQAINWWRDGTKRYYQLAVDWADMLDGSIFRNQSFGTGVSSFAWSGSLSNGGIDPDNCQGFTSSQAIDSGKEGAGFSTTSSWLSSSSGGCEEINRVRCASICPVPSETSCVDGEDNDGDNLTDCADLECSGQTGPSGETCQPTGETICNDGFDNDGDGLADCFDQSCSGDAACQEITAIYVTTEPRHQGNLAGREGADEWCHLHEPSNLPSNCTNARAFLSVTGQDEIRDMPSKYNFPSNEAVYWLHNEEQAYYQFASNWNDMLDGSISLSQEDGTGIRDPVWSGSKEDGSKDTVLGNCQDWTYSGAGEDPFSVEKAATGMGETTNLWWLYNNIDPIVGPRCNSSDRLRCVARCNSPREVCVGLGGDEDGDGLLDCNDPDCFWGDYCMPKFVIYTATEKHNGDFASYGNGDARVGADNWCQANKPAEAWKCLDAYAFISVNEADEIRDIWGNYFSFWTGNEAVYWLDETGTYNRFASNWNDMLDGQIIMSQKDATGKSNAYWTGSDSSGAITTDYCSSWSEGLPSSRGTAGIGSEVLGNWLQYSNQSCALERDLLCICGILDVGAL